MKRLSAVAILFILIGSINFHPSVKADTGVWFGNRGGQDQERTQTKPTCGPGEAVSGDLGYAGTECHGCVISGRHVLGEPDIMFDSAPLISDIRKGGPADGKLAEKDALAAIDGDAITTRAAAIKLSWLEPGKPVRLTVRREGVPTEVEITPTARCRRVNPPRPGFIIIRRSL